VDMLEVNQAIEHYKAKGLDFSRVLYQPDISNGAALYCTNPPTHDLAHTLDEQLIEQSCAALEHKKIIKFSMNIRNFNRSVGGRLSAEIARRYGSKGLPPDTISVKFTGSAGQSFGAFLAPGITFELEGDTNDYLGKGLSGGRIIIYPPRQSSFLAQNNIIAGNANLFGATGGEAYINGMVGERFCVRNSGAVAIVEGVGDHGCEYMTGGRVIVIGKTGVNFAAGMSGGIAYVLDENQLFDTRCNLEMVEIEPVISAEDITFLHTYLQKHYDYTKSEYAAQVLENWEDMLPYFVKVMPIDYRHALMRIQQQESRETDLVGMTEEVFL
jgi:glutamate synthase (NADPH) large chain